MLDINGNEYFTHEKISEIIYKKFRQLDIYTKDIDTELLKVYHEYKKDLNYIYLECKNKNWYMKRYYKLVYSYGFTNCEYIDANAIDNDKSYNIEDVKDSFKNKLIYLLSKTI